MNYAECRTLPLGSVKAEGFLKEQLIRSKNGMGGHLPEIEPGMIANPYVNKTYVKRWGNRDQSGWGAEISGNYYSGLILLAYTLNDTELIAKAETWVNALLKKQKEDGYLGTYCEPDAPIYEDYNAWGTSAGMRALLFFYEATGREDVFEAVYRCMIWFTEKWANHKTCYSGLLICEPMLYCYKKTGDERLLKFCIDYEEYLCEHSLFENSYKSYLDPKLYYNSNHSAAYATTVRIPAMLYAVTGDKKYLDASVNGIKKVREKATQLNGGIVSDTEYLGPVSGVAETEYCVFTFLNTTYSYMTEITGNASYGDMMEEIAYNGAQGAKKKDERAIAYLSSPNQIYATDRSSPAFGDMQVYSPCYPVSCCPVNSVAVIPEFIRGMAMTDADKNLYFSAYGPCAVSYGGWEVREETAYPFRNEIKFVIGKAGGKTVYLKKPVWCKKFSCVLDGKIVDAIPDENGFIAVRGAIDGSVILFEAEAEVEVIHVKDDDAAGKHPIAFRYGALLFSLEIKSRWNKFYPETETPLTPEWPWYNVNPVFDADKNTVDPHERLAVDRENFTWNVAVDENIKPEDIKLEFADIGDKYPWEEAPIKLRVPAYKAPYAVALYPSRTFEPFEKKLYVTHPVELTLVPYGNTNIRITYFPRADLDK